MIDFAKLPDLELIKDPGLRARASQKSTNKDTQHYIIRENGKELVFLSLDFHPHPDALFIYEIFVSSSVRGQGVGTRLLREIENLARRNGYSNIGLNAHPLDDRPKYELIAWYEKRGFSLQAGSKELMMKTL